MLRSLLLLPLLLLSMSLWAQVSQVFHEPPQGDRIRSMAEWEENEALVVTWTSQKAILAQIISAAKQECEVIVICSSASSAEFQLLNQYGLDNLDNVTLLEAPYNSIWGRDYGGNTIYIDGELALVDWVYNRTFRQDDNNSPIYIADHLDIDLYVTDEEPWGMVHTGGNYHTDGDGMAFSSDLFLEENDFGNPYGVEPKTEEELQEILSAFMGIDEFVFMPALPYDVINHIDMHMRFLDEETLLVGEYPEGVSDGPQIEANINYVLSQFTSMFGTPFEIVRIPMPPEGSIYPSQGGDYRTYTNSVIVNEKILVPTYNHSDDAEALGIYEEHMPGYEVIGINCNPIIPSLGALHCITKEVGAKDQLRIVHQKIRDQIDNEEDLLVEAMIENKNGIATAHLYYKEADSEDFIQVPMTLEDPDTDLWVASIANPGVPTTMDYYIEAESSTGKIMQRPMTAPEGFWEFDLDFSSSVTDLWSQMELRFEAVYPNPASAITCIPIHTAHALDQAQLQLLDINGQIIQDVYEGGLKVGENNFFVDASNLTSGAYMIAFKTPFGCQYQKLIVK